MRPLLEAAVVRARQGEADRPPRRAPSALRPFIHFQKLPSRALSAARSVLDTDAEFRLFVAESVAEGELEEGAELFLRRPDGWRDDYARCLAEARGEADAASEERRERDAGRRLDRVEAALKRAEEEAERLRADLAGVRRELDEERRLRLAAEKQAIRADRLASERAEAVRAFKDSERRLAEQHTEARRLSSQLAALEQELAARPEGGEGATGPGPPGEGAPKPEPEPEGPADGRPEPWEVAADDLRAAAEAAGRLGESLAAIARRWAEGGGGRPPGPGGSPGGGPAGSPAGGSSPARRSGSEGPGPERSARPQRVVGLPGVPGGPGDRPPRPGRRRAPRLGRGLVEGTPEAAREVLSRPGQQLLVDGYNVTMAWWPDLGAAAQRESLVTALGSLRASLPAEIEVIFDGTGAGGRPPVSVARSVRVCFSPEGVEADDEILARLDLLPAEQAVAVCSADRRVQDGARERGASVLTPDQLAALLRR